MAIPFAYNVQSLLVRKATTTATALGVALVVFVLVSSMMLARGVERTMVMSGDPNGVVMLRNGAGTELASSIEKNALASVAGTAGIKRDADGQPLLAGDVVVVLPVDRVGGGEETHVGLRGVEPAAFGVRSSVKIVEGRKATPGTDEAIMGRGVVGKFQGLALGGNFALRDNRSVKIVGVFDAGGSALESEVWADIDTVRTALGREGVYSSITAVLESSEKFNTFAASVAADKAAGLEAIREREYYKTQSEGTSTVIVVVGVLVTVFFVLSAMIGAMITMYSAVGQRTREIGTLRALGFTRPSIVAAFVFESGLVALGGGILGVLLSLITSTFKLSTLNYNTWQEVTFSFEVSASVVLTGLFVGVAVGVFGGLLPAFKAARVSPVEALRG
jgi:putative ABC transport system permease protein